MFSILKELWFTFFFFFLNRLLNTSTFTVVDVITFAKDIFTHFVPKGD